jgi:hypothetical protein
MEKMLECVHKKTHYVSNKIILADIGDIIYIFINDGTSRRQEQQYGTQ